MFLRFQVDEDDFEEEQNSVARLIHMLYSDDPEEMFKVHESLAHLDSLSSLYVDIGFLVFGLYLDFFMFQEMVLEDTDNLKFS